MGLNNITSSITDPIINGPFITGYCHEKVAQCGCDAGPKISALYVGSCSPFDGDRSVVMSLVIRMQSVYYSTTASLKNTSLIRL